jgi:hypothetical protein
MSNKAPDSARGHCDRASERLQRAADLLNQTEELRKSVARMRVTSDTPVAEVEGSLFPPPPQPIPMRRTPSVVLIRDSKGDLRVKKD